jgi:hypothetical protein
MAYNCFKTVPEFSWGVLNGGGEVAEAMWNFSTERGYFEPKGYTLDGLRAAWHDVAIVEQRLRKIGILLRNHQLVDTAELLVDEPAQLGWAVAVSSGNCAAQQGNTQEHGRSCAPSPFRRRRFSLTMIRVHKLPFRWVLHTRYLHQLGVNNSEE